MKSLLLLDYDGTLAPFKINREKAYPYKGVVERLQKLNQHVVLISGRSVSDFEGLLKFYPLPPIWGSHGLEKYVDGRYMQEKVDRKTEEAILEAKEICRHLPNCEIKPFGVAIHTRGFKGSTEEVHRQLKKLNRMQLHDFDGGFELRPKGRNKGDVVKEILREIPKDTVVAYLGDDRTDEDAFKALGNRGLKVLVRKKWRPTLADIHITPPKELLAFLDRWIEVYHG